MLHSLAECIVIAQCVEGVASTQPALHMNALHSVDHDSLWCFSAVQTSWCILRSCMHRSMRTLMPVTSCLPITRRALPFFSPAIRQALVLFMCDDFMPNHEWGYWSTTLPLPDGPALTALPFANPRWGALRTVPSFGLFLTESSFDLLKKTQVWGHSDLRNGNQCLAATPHCCLV